MAVLNLAILLLVIFEGLRTRGWRGLPSFNFADPMWFLGARYNHLRHGHAHSSYDRILGDATEVEGMIVTPPSGKSDIDMDLLIDLSEYGFVHRGTSSETRMIPLDYEEHS